MLKKLAILASALLLSFPVFAQNVQYVAPVTRNHIPVWNTNGVIADGGSSADSPISSIGVTNEGGAGICVSSGRQTAAGRNQLCLGASTAGPATISLQNFGTATAQNLQFIINGTAVTIPSGGTNFLQLSGAATNGHVPCFSGTIGLVVDCGTSIGAGTQFGLPYYSTTSSLGSTGAGTNGQLLIGQSGSVPLWQTIAGDVGSLSPGGLLTLAKVNGIPFASTYSAHGVLIGQGTSAFNTITTPNIGQCLLSQGAAADPIWSSCASGSGSAGGSNTQVQFNSSTALGGSANFTWVSPTLTLGVAGTATGQLAFAPAGSGTGTVTVQNPSTTSAFNFNLPTTAGALGQPLLSGGGGSTAMSFGTLGVAGGGTNCAVASGTCLDNISGFASTGYVFRSGGGTYTFSTVIPVSSGGTNLANGTSGGVLAFTGSTTIASSGELAQFGIVVGGGAGSVPQSVTNGTAGQVLLAQTSANPTWNTLSGDATISSVGALTIANSAVTVAKQANAAAWTLEGNFTGSSAAPQFSTIGGLTVKASPAASDLVLIQDQAASGALKQATVSSISSAGSVSSIAGNTGSFTLAAGVTNSVNQIQLDVSFIPNFLSGYGFSNDVGDANNSIDIATGVAADSTNAVLIKLASAIVKKKNASWVVGTNQGCWDTGSFSSGTIHYWAIRRSDTGVVDVLCSASASAPVLPTNYDSKRLINSLTTSGGNMVAFIQDGNYFSLNVPVNDINATNPGTSAVTRTLSVPTGVRVRANVSGGGTYATDGSNTGVGMLLSDLSVADTVPTTSIAQVVLTSQTANNMLAMSTAQIFTNTSAQIRSRISVSNANVTERITTFGWMNTRGQ
jgi:hypothetical protein